MLRRARERCRAPENWIAVLQFGGRDGEKGQKVRERRRKASKGAEGQSERKACGFGGDFIWYGIRIGGG